MSSISELQEKLVSENLNLVHFCIRKYFSFPRNDYDDYFQTGTIGLLKASCHYQPTVGKFSTFAARCIINEINGMLRSSNTKGRKLKSPLLSLDCPVEKESSATLGSLIRDPHDEISSRIEKIAIQSALDKIGHRDRKMFELYLSGKSQFEIGKMFNVSQGCVSKRIDRVRNKLKSELAS